MEKSVGRFLRYQRSMGHTAKTLRQLKWDAGLARSIAGDANVFRMSKERRGVVDAVAATRPDRLTAKSLAEYLGKNYYSVRKLADELKADGLLDQLGNRHY